MSVTTTSLSDVDRDLLKKIILLLEAQVRGSSQVVKFSDVDSKVVTST